jgi:hypothetical protein
MWRDDYLTVQRVHLKLYVNFNIQGRVLLNASESEPNI